MPVEFALYVMGESVNAEMQELLAQLRAAKLTDRQLACLSLYYFDGLTQQEIAEQLNIRQQVVSQHIEYGFKKLAALGLEPQRLEMDAPPKIQLMDPRAIDALGPDDIKAVW